MKLSTLKHNCFSAALVLFAVLWSSSVFAQTITISGTVTAADSGEPLIGANILVQNTAIGTTTEIDGTYSLEIPNPNAVLEVTYVGYQLQIVNVAGRTTIDIAMEPDAGLLEEVVVIGYGTQRKGDLTGSVATVEGSELSKIPTASLQQALQGKVPGVQVVTTSGRPGEGAIVRIRGVGTLNNADPLYVIDGVIMPENVDINSLVSPNDIENLSVLKDASAAAIYGARGANGVILITTKKGTTGDRSIVSFSTYQASQEIVKTIPLANAREYAILANQVVINEIGANAPLPFPDPDALGEGTDWQKEVYQTAPIQNYNLSLSGGSDRVNYTISGDYFDQEGIVPGSLYERLTVRANSDYKVKTFLKIGHNLAFIHTNENLAPDVVGNTYRADPTVIGYNEETGAYGNTATRSSVGNSLGQLKYQNDNKRRGNRLLGTLYADVNFLKNFTFRSSFGVTLFWEQAQAFTPRFFVSEQQQAEINNISLSEYESRNWLWENTLSYNKEWTNIRLNLVGGITAQDNYWELLSASAQDFPYESESLRFFPLAALDGRTITNSASSSSILSYLFRANTTIFEKYLLTASIRADGSSRFGKNNRFGYFPSFALGWRITEEAFMDNQQLFSNLKLRAGWGQTGNDRIGDYTSKALIAQQLFAVFGTSESLLNGGSLLELSNPDLRWESTTQANIGFELGFFKNKLSAEIDYYNRTTNDILWAVPIPGSVGLENPPVINAAKVRNQGLDLLLSWQDRKTIGYRVTLTGSTINNEVLQLSDGSEEYRSGGLGFGGELGNITRAGLSIGSFYGFESDGIIQSQQELDALNQSARERTGNPNAFYRSADTKPGDIKFRDINGDGIITGDDRTILGSPIPDVVFGLNLGVDFKGIELSVDFAGQAGNEIINSKKMARFNTPNFETSYLDFWTPENPNTSEPRVTNSGDNYLLTPRFIEDGSFIALRNVQLGYTLPTDLTKKFYLSNLRIYVSGSNLVYWTKYTGYTPEIVNSNPFESGIDRGTYPISRVYTVGLNASF